MAFDRTKPVTGERPASSQNLRDNWLALQRAALGYNLLADPTYLIWPVSDAASPAHWLASGASVAVARIGTGLGDTLRKHGKFAAKITSGAGDVGRLDQNLLPSGDYDDGFDGLTVSFGAWVYATAASAARLRVYDGASSTNSSYHTGSSTWEWLTVTHTISGSATLLMFGLEVAAGTNVGRISAPAGCIGEVPPLYPMPPNCSYELFEFDRLAGTITTGADKDRLIPHRPGIVKEVQLWLKTAPTGQALIVDVNTWDGGSFVSMFSTRPQCAATATRGSAIPDTTYARRCFTGASGAVGSPAAGQFVSYDVDQVGSGTAGADLKVQIRYLTFNRPLEAFLSATALA